MGARGAQTNISLRDWQNISNIARGRDMLSSKAEVDDTPDIVRLTIGIDFSHSKVSV